MEIENTSVEAENTSMKKLADHVTKKDEATESTHAWPHVPAMQWEQVWGPVSNTVITTFIFMILIISLAVITKNALKKEKSRLKEFFLNIVWFIDSHLIDSFQDKKFARAFLPLIGWIFIIIFFWNLFWLVIDWFIAAFDKAHISAYLRPMNSDLNTTLVLWLITVITFLWISVKYSWVKNTIAWFVFNYKWNSVVEKCINVFVWWLHLIWVFATVASLSLRLFWNIFAWIVLIWVIWYLWALMTHSLLQVWLFLSLPFWFFELFVAFIQAAVFAWLMIAYFGQSKEAEH